MWATQNLDLGFDVTETKFNACISTDVNLSTGSPLPGSKGFSAIVAMRTFVVLSIETAVLSIEWRKRY